MKHIYVTVPVLSGFLLCYFNFQWLSTACALIYFVSSPFMLFSRNVNRTKINEEDRQVKINKISLCKYYGCYTETFLDTNR